MPVAGGWEELALVLPEALWRDSARAYTVHVFGWITAATILNTGIWLKGRGVTSLGLGAEAWATVLLLVAAGIGVFIVRRCGEVLYGLVMIWAAWGIVVSHPRVGSKLIAAGLLSAAITAAIAWSLRSRRPALVQPSA